MAKPESWPNKNPKQQKNSIQMIINNYVGSQKPSKSNWWEENEELVFHNSLLPWLDYHRSIGAAGTRLHWPARRGSGAAACGSPLSAPGHATQTPWNYRWRQKHQLEKSSKRTKKQTCDLQKNKKIKKIQSVSLRINASVPEGITGSSGNEIKIPLHKSNSPWSHLDLSLCALKKEMMGAIFPQIVHEMHTTPFIIHKKNAPRESKQNFHHLWDNQNSIMQNKQPNFSITGVALMSLDSSW